MPTTLLCTFNPLTGWRVHQNPGFSTTQVKVISILGTKYLLIPSVDQPRPGWFCNPKKLVIAFVRDRTQKAKAKQEEADKPTYRDRDHVAHRIGNCDAWMREATKPSGSRLYLH